MLLIFEFCSQLSLLAGACRDKTGPYFHSQNSAVIHNKQSARNYRETPSTEENEQQVKSFPVNDTDAPQATEMRWVTPPGSIKIKYLCLCFITVFTRVSTKLWKWTVVAIFKESLIYRVETVVAVICQNAVINHFLMMEGPICQS